MITRHRVVAAAAVEAAIVTAVVLLALLVPVPTNGPLGDSSVFGIGIECFPIPHEGEIVTDGFTAVQNSGEQPVVIDKVMSIDPVGLKLITAYAVPAGTAHGYDLYGDMPGLPPNGGPMTAPDLQWAHRQYADGAKIPHTTGGKVYNLLLVLRSSGMRATNAGVDVLYHVGWAHYELRTTVAMVAIVAKACSA